MSSIYCITVRGRRMESRDLKKLLAQAVLEKRVMDQRLRLSARIRSESGSVLDVETCECRPSFNLPQ